MMKGMQKTSTCDFLRIIYKQRDYNVYLTILDTIEDAKEYKLKILIRNVTIRNLELKNKFPLWETVFNLCEKFFYSFWWKK